MDAARSSKFGFIHNWRLWGETPRSRTHIRESVGLPTDTH